MGNIFHVHGNVIAEETTITGPASIGNATSFGNVTVTGTVNGLNFSEDVVQVHKNYTITGKKMFDDVVIRDDLNSPVVDGVDIDDLCDNVLLNNGNQNLTGTLTVNGKTFVKVIRRHESAIPCINNGVDIWW